MKSRTLTASREEELLRWWTLSLESTGDDPFWAISDYAIYRLRDIRYVEGILDRLASKLSECPAKCPSQFREWCRNQIDKEAAKLVVSEKAKRKGTKPFQYSEKDGVCSIPLQDAEGKQHIWKVPSDWLNDIESKIWPCHIRWYANGKPYVARKKSVICPDERKQVILPAHHLLLWYRYPGISSSDIACSRARNGDFLDWTGNNIYVPAFDGFAMSKATKAFKIKLAVSESSRKQIDTGNGYETIPVGIDKKVIQEWEEKLAAGMPGERDITECGFKSGLDVDKLMRPGCNGIIDGPAKPTRPPGHGPAMDDREAWMTSQFYSGIERAASYDGAHAA